MRLTWNRNWLVEAILAVAPIIGFDSELYTRTFAGEAELGVAVSAVEETESPNAEADEAAAKPKKPVEDAEPAAEKPASKDDGKSDPNEEDVPAGKSDDSRLRTLKESIANELRRNALVCGVVFGDVTAETLEITVLLEESKKKHPSVEDLTMKIRRLSGEREVKLEAKPWAAAARLKELQDEIKSKPDLADIKLTNLFLLGLSPNKLACQLRGSAKDPNSQEALVEAVSGLVTEFETPAGKPNVVDPMIEVNLDSGPLLKAIQESLASDPDLVGLRVDRVTATKDPVNSVWKLELRGDSPLPQNDDVKLVKLVDDLVESNYPKWKNKLELQTPVLADRVPEPATTLAGIQKALKSSSDWKGCEITQIVAAKPGDAGRLVWTLKGKATQPLQESQLIALCHEVVLQVSPWWKRAKDRLQIVSQCSVVFPAPEPFVAHIQALMKSDPNWRGCLLKRIDASTLGGTSDRGGPAAMTWSLVGEVNNPGQKERLMSLVQEEHCRVHPEWKEYSGLQFIEQLKQVPVDPAPVLKALQAKLYQNPGWGGCNLTGLECPVCSKPDADQPPTWQILGTVAFMPQKADLVETAGEAFREVYPGWGPSDPPQIDPNLVKIVPPSAAKLLSLIQYDLERNPEFDDCQIVDAVIDNNSNSESSAQPLQLRLIGRTTRSTHQQALVSLDHFPSLKMTYGKKVTSGDEPLIIPNPSDVDVVKSSRGLAGLQLEIGQNHYVHCRFREAKLAFASAMFEDASNLNYKLWHVAMCMACGDEPLAHDRLFNILKGHRAEYRENEGFHFTMRSLERLQGPLRRQLENLERQVLSEIAVVQAQARR